MSELFMFYLIWDFCSSLLNEVLMHGTGVSGILNHQQNFRLPKVKDLWTLYLK